MAETTDSILLRLLENIILRGHEHIIANFRDREKVFEYMKDKQKPALDEITRVCRIHFAKISAEQKEDFLKIVEQVAAYKGIIDLILKDPDKNRLLGNSIENMNDAYEKLKDAIEVYKNAIKIYKGMNLKTAA
jgi:hypothetical protein